MGEGVKVEENGKYYDARIVDIKDNKYKIHFKGYNARCDIWLLEDSSRFFNVGDSEDEFADAPDGKESSTEASQHPPENNRVTVEQGRRSSHLGATHSVSQVCQLCKGDLGNSVVSCGDCSQSFHARKVCLGVEDDVIEILLREVSGAIKYVCCTCRNGRAKSDQQDQI